MNQHTEWTFPTIDEGTQNGMNTTTPEIKEDDMNTISIKAAEHNTGNKPSTARKPRVSKETKLNTLRDHLEAGHSLEEIQVCMNLSQAEFAVLYFELTQVDGRSYTIQRTRRTRHVKVGVNGNFQISADNIERMGLDEIFKEGAVVSFRRDGDSIVATVVTDAKIFDKAESVSIKAVDEPVESPENEMVQTGSDSVAPAPVKEEEEMVSIPASELRRLMGQESPKVAILEREVA